MVACFGLYSQKYGHNRPLLTSDYMKQPLSYTHSTALSSSTWIMYTVHSIPPLRSELLGSFNLGGEPIAREGSPSPICEKYCHNANKLSCQRCTKIMIWV